MESGSRAEPLGSIVTISKLCFYFSLFLVKNNASPCPKQNKTSRSHSVTQKEVNHGVLEILFSSDVLSILHGGELAT